MKQVWWWGQALGDGVSAGKCGEEEDTVLPPSLASYYLKLLTKSTLKYKPTKFRMYFFLPITVDHISMPRVVNVIELDILNHLYYFPKIWVSHFRKCKTDCWQISRQYFTVYFLPGFSRNEVLLNITFLLLFTEVLKY